MDLKTLLAEARTVAVVGLSPNRHRPSYGVAAYLQAHGYRIVPVNPFHREILGETSYPDLRSIPEDLRRQIDIVDVFRKASEVMVPARDAIDIGAKVLWLQLGVVNEEAKTMAEAAGLTVVMDRCIKIEHAYLIGD